MKCQSDDRHFFVAISCFVNVSILLLLRLFFPFSEENKTLLETAPSLFVDTSLTNITYWLVHEKSSLTELAPRSSANAVRPHEMRAQNGATFHQVPTAPLFLDSCHWRTAAACTQHPYLTALAPLSSAFFCICTRHAHCCIPCPPNMDCSQNASLSPMCGLHPPPNRYMRLLRTAHAYQAVVAMEDEKEAKGANLRDFPRRYKKCRSVIWHSM